MSFDDFKKFTPVNKYAKKSEEIEKKEKEEPFDSILSGPNKSLYQEVQMLKNENRKLREDITTLYMMITGLDKEINSELDIREIYYQGLQKDSTHVRNQLNANNRKEKV